MKTDREEFEAWANQRDEPPNLSRRENGNYVQDMVQIVWEVWQAARAGMVRKEEIRIAWEEGWCEVRTIGQGVDGREIDWAKSASKRVMEGEE